MKVGAIIPQTEIGADPLVYPHPSLGRYSYHSVVREPLVLGRIPDRCCSFLPRGGA